MTASCTPQSAVHEGVTTRRDRRCSYAGNCSTGVSGHCSRDGIASVLRQGSRETVLIDVIASAVTESSAWRGGEWVSPESSPGELTGVDPAWRGFIPGRQWSRDQVALWLVGRWCGGSDPARACAGGGGRLTAPRLRAQGQLVGCSWSRVAVQWPLQYALFLSLVSER